MPEENDKIATKTQFATLRKRGIAANLHNYQEEIKNIDPLTRVNRLGLICDDSASMSGQAIEDAHTAVANFVTQSKPVETSICIYPLNAEPKPLSCDYDVIRMYWSSIGATGGTSLYGRLKEIIADTNITRAIAFSDGEPTDSYLITGTGWNSSDKTLAEEVVKIYKEKKVPVDTVFIGRKDSGGYKEMEELAKQTDGLFIHFTDSASLSRGLKYLTPGLRGLLANAEIKEKIQRGESV